MAAPPNPLADELEIRALAAAYSDAVNRRRPDACSAVYTPDGVLRGPGIEPVVGRDAITAFLGSVFERWEWLFQITPGGVVRCEEDRAVSRFPIVEHGRGLDGRGTEFFGFYDDHLVRTGDGWRFAERTVHTVYFGVCERTGKRHQLPDIAGAPAWLQA